MTINQLTQLKAKFLFEGLRPKLIDLINWIQLKNEKIFQQAF